MLGAWPFIVRSIGRQHAFQTQKPTRFVRDKKRSRQRRNTSFLVLVHDFVEDIHVKYQFGGDILDIQTKPTPAKGNTRVKGHTRANVYVDIEPNDP